MPKKTKDDLVYEFMRGFILEHNYSPSVREVCAATGISSTATVFDTIERLIHAGRMKKAEGKKRAYEVCGLRYQYHENRISGVVNVPLVGRITAGAPIEAVENVEETMPLPTAMFGSGEMFMLKVFGESMINAGIYDGDTIVVKRQPTAENGEIAAIMLDGEATVKRFYRENGHFRLQPENDTMEAIIADNAEILGVVTGLLRKM
jgi:repressor LexA